MRRWKATRRISLVAMAAGLLCCIVAQAKKPDKPPGGGGGTTAPYTVVDLLGFPITLAGDTFSQSAALSVNEPDGFGAVQVVGDAISQYDPALDPALLLNPVLWEVNADGSFTLTDLGLPPGAWEASATDINNWGVITINTLQSPTLIRPGWVSVPGLPLQQLPFSGDSADPLGINNFNEIAGTHANISGAWWQLVAGLVPESPVNLVGFIPSDIADSGVMAGYYQNFLPAIAYFEGGVFTVERLDPSRGAALGSATAISPNGTWVVGWIGSNVDGGDATAFRWSATTGLTPLGRVGGDASIALGVDNAGQVVGWSKTGKRKHPQTAFLWQNGQMFDLDSLADTGGKVQLLEATAINNAGHIVGTMELTSRGSTEEHGFVLVPTPPEQ